MIRLTIYFQYPVPAFITQIFNDVVNTFFYFTLQHGFPVLCYQYHMVLQQKTAVAVCIIKLVFFTLIHEIFLTIHYVIIIPQKQRLLKRYTHTYSVSRIMIKEQHPLYSYCMETTAASKRLYNAALFRIRNRFTGYRKVALTDHELQVLEELDTL